MTKEISPVERKNTVKSKALTQVGWGGSALWGGGGGLGEDVMCLLLHQHRHVLHISAPGVQPLLHTFDLGAEATGTLDWVHTGSLKHLLTDTVVTPTCCRSRTRGCTQVICTFWSTSSMLPLTRPTDRAFITSSSTCRTTADTVFSPSKSILDHWWKTFDIHEHWPRSRGPWCSERSLWRSTVCGWKDEWKSSVGERTSLSLCSWVTVLTYTEFLTLVIRKMLTILLQSWNRVTMQNVSCFLCVCVYSHLHDTQQLDFLHQFRLMGCEVWL